MKTVFPTFWFGILGVLVAAVLWNGPREKAAELIGVPCVMGIFGYIFFRRTLWDLADEVMDCGDYLLVKLGGKEENVALSNIVSVRATTFLSPPRITLQLASPEVFGDEIVFSPVARFSLNPFARNRIADDLTARADSARPGRAV